MTPITILYSKYLITNSSKSKKDDLINGAIGICKQKTSIGYILTDGSFIRKEQVLRELNPVIEINSRKNVIKYLKENRLIQNESNDKMD